MNNIDTRAAAEPTPETTLSDLESLLRTRYIASVSLTFQLSGVVFAQAVTCASRGPDGPFSTSSVSGTSVAHALARLIEWVDRAVLDSVVVRDSQGRLRGVYPRTDEGRGWANKMLGFLGPDATKWEKT